MSDPRSGTLFKRRAQAIAVLRAYGTKYPPKLARVKVDKRGNLIIGSLPVSDHDKRQYRKWIREWDNEHGAARIERQVKSWRRGPRKTPA